MGETTIIGYFIIHLLLLKDNSHNINVSVKNFLQILAKFINENTQNEPDDPEMCGQCFISNGRMFKTRATICICGKILQMLSKDNGLQAIQTSIIDPNAFTVQNNNQPPSA
jgi:hypothetical protein